MNVEPYEEGTAVCGLDMPKIEQVDDLLRYLATVRSRFGNTAIQFSLNWGASALWVESDAKAYLQMPSKVMEVCQAKGWSLDWTALGAYLHLEASELIEAVRGKHGDPVAEAADVLIVLMSITESQGIHWDAVLSAARQTLVRLKSETVRGAA